MLIPIEWWTIALFVCFGFVFTAIHNLIMMLLLDGDGEASVAVSCATGGLALFAAAVILAISGWTQ